jgi:alkylhydroperoxidase/carboxymuconolactone decarboxylase family protein YurZ
MNCHNIDDYFDRFLIDDDCQNEIVMEAGRLDDVEAIWIVIAVAAYTQDVL